ncbi:MAG: membrane associated rhomboid family serine protease [Crocinitomicaceae bacterium]|jgi:membrane associated rhomboid family serine protease
MQTQRSISEEIKHQYRTGGVMIQLIFANVVIFLLINLLGVIGRLSGGEVEGTIGVYLMNIFELQTEPGIFITHPWGLFTSIFAHYSFLHLLTNMIFLYFAGKLFLSLFSQKRLFYTYLLGGILGGVFEMVAQIFPAVLPNTVIGASGSVMAIIIAIAVHKPRMKVNLFGILPVQMYIIGGVYFLLDFIKLGENDGTAHFAHLGGATLGMISVLQLSSPSNIINITQRFGDRIQNLFRRKPSKKRLKVDKNSRMKTDDEYRVDSVGRQEQVDRILDKISKSGYESLTRKEKDFLFKQSNNG